MCLGIKRGLTSFSVDFVKNVSRHLLMWLNMREFILERNLTLVLSVGEDLLRKEI